ncbi:Stk1 family PASTA domain-containing Ser/Thr kinase [soil metagenome]
MTSNDPNIIGDRYELAETLGRGGMAEVRKGVDTRLGRIVAVKRLRSDLAADSTFQARFRREAQSSASLNHPTIVAVYDTGEEPRPNGVTTPYIVMEYVSGRTLRDILREGRKILPERALEITSGVLSALDYSHRAGIIHRDIKPGNIMLTPAGEVKVMDFGIARAMSDAASTMTQTAAVVGTAQYLSPEQARGEQVDSRSDVYSAGCVLYELLTGRPPFVGDSPVAVAYQHVRENPVPPSQVDSSLPPELDPIVMKALAKRVEDRYQSAAAMRADIEQYLSGRPVKAAAMPAPETQRTQVVAPVPAPVEDEYDDDEESRSNTPLVIGLALLLLALIAAAIIFMPRLFESAPERVSIPDVSKMKEDNAQQVLLDANLTVNPERVLTESDTIAAGRVIETDPPAGEFVEDGTEITLYVSSGKPTTMVPILQGKMLKDARKALNDADLKWDTVQVESDQPSGTVVSSDPAAGETVNVGDTVTLSVSEGPTPLESVVGMDIDAAQQAIEDQGFTVKVQEDPNASDVPYGQVTSQFPDAGTTLAQGSQVLLTYSTYVAGPTANDDTAQTFAGQGINIKVLDNDTAADDVKLDKSQLVLLDSFGSATSLVQTAEGNWLVKGNGAVRFVPADGYVGTTAPVTYQIADENGKTDTATITVTVS